MAPLGVSFHLLIEDQGIVLSAILVPFDSNGFYVVSLGYVILSKVVPRPFPSCFKSIFTFACCEGECESIKEWTVYARQTSGRGVGWKWGLTKQKRGGNVQD